MAAEPAHVGYTQWLTAARGRAARRLEGLARPVPTNRGWADLVLDDDRSAILHDICGYVRLRETVLGEWGMAARTGVARGLSVLFAGPPGTGKTMAAGVVAAELGLELFVVDLSQVVSKYIGETEKNLARVFDAAEDSGAVLLFDEADALFGTRTEISDAHDRYANIETSYLLQRMEAYDGVAVLASNLRQNLDDAFLRRLRYVVDFQLPDPEQRRRIWDRHLGGGVPVGELNLDLLAARLPIAGGSIRNIALAAAFLAAAERESLGMDHLVRASRREFEKLGKLWRDPLDGVARTGVAR
jgi:SpoVK/Ycf46/Vps4 family AAA+-type ATPase